MAQQTYLSFSCLFLGIFLAGSALADHEVNGRVFYDALDPKNPSFWFHSVVTENGTKKKVVSTYSDKQNKPLVVEESEFENDRLVAYRYQQLQVSEHGEAKFRGQTMDLSFFEDGKTETDSEEFDSSLIVAPMIGSVLQKNWPTLVAGDDLKVRYLAIERLETIGFKFYKDKERKLHGQDVVDIVMKPSSVFISALVSPVRIAVTKAEPHWIVESNGRTPIRVPEVNPPRSRKDWKAIDARVEYDAPKTLKPGKAKKKKSK